MTKRTGPTTPRFSQLTPLKAICDCFLKILGKKISYPQLLTTTKGRSFRRSALFVLKLLFHPPCVPGFLKRTLISDFLQNSDFREEVLFGIETEE